VFVCFFPDCFHLCLVPLCIQSVFLFVWCWIIFFSSCVVFARVPVLETKLIFSRNSCCVWVLHTTHHNRTIRPRRMDPALESVAHLFRPLSPSVFRPSTSPSPCVYQPSSHQPWQPPTIPAAVAWSEEKDTLLQGTPREALRALVTAFQLRFGPVPGIPSPVPVPDVPVPGVPSPVPVPDVPPPALVPSVPSLSRPVPVPPVPSPSRPALVPRAPFPVSRPVPVPGPLAPRSCPPARPPDRHTLAVEVDEKTHVTNKAQICYFALCNQK